MNADSYASTGQGVLGHNMFAYCGNNPVNRIDPTGQFGISALLLTGLVAVCSLSLSGCSEEPEPTPEPYKSAEEAAIAFSEEVYSSSLYIRHEYCAEIYSRTINGETTYNYTTPRVGKPHSIKIRPLTPSGTKMVAYAHTHPISNVFSPDDITVAKDYGIDGYVVGPSLELLRYNYGTQTTVGCGFISPRALTDEERADLVARYQTSWDQHISQYCKHGCRYKYKEWPTP